METMTFDVLAIDREGHTSRSEIVTNDMAGALFGAAAISETLWCPTLSVDDRAEYWRKEFEGKGLMKIIEWFDEESVNNFSNIVTIINKTLGKYVFIAGKYYKYVMAKDITDKIFREAGCL